MLLMDTKREREAPLSFRIPAAELEDVDREVQKDYRSQRVDLVEPIWAWAWAAYKRAGSLRRLIDESSLRFYSRRISRDTQEQLYTALETAFERAPSSAIEKLAETITRLAGAPWEERGTAAEPDYERQAAAGKEATREDAASTARHRKGVARR